MSHALRTESPDVEVWCPTKAEWDAFVRDGLRELGLSYEELERQATEDDFDSSSAKSFWFLIREP